MGGDAALTLLREEFEDDDLTCKRRAAERIDLVAQALGPEAARSKLIPWLMDHSDENQEDEVLYFFATKCMALFNLIGGAEYIDVILPLLERLLAVEETFVRDAAVECAQKMIEALKNTSPLVKVVSRLSTHEWFTARMSASALCGPLITKASGDEDVAKLKEVFYLLCKDETPMVRRSIAKEVEALLQKIPSEETISEVIPLFSKLASDPQEAVALNWIGVVGVIACALSNAQSTEHLLPMVKEYCTDRSWRVRFTVAQNFDKVCRGMGSATTQEALLPLFCELLRDPEGEVRNVASEHVVSICQLVQGNLFCEYVMPVFAGLMEMDQLRAVRLNLASASVNETLVSTLGKAKVKEHLVPIWEMCLRDSAALYAPEVRLIIINGLDQVIEAMGSTFVGKSWSPLLRELFETSRHFNNGGGGDALMNPNNVNSGAPEEIEHPQWRIRVAVLGALEKLAKAEDPSLDKLIVDLWYSGISDEVSEVRITAGKTLESFCSPSSPIGPNKVTSLFVPRLLEFFKQSKLKYHHRVAFVHAFGSLLKSGQGVVEPLFAGFEKCLDDKVPNVRIAALSVLENVSDEAFKEKFSKQIHALAQDSDPDVSEEADRVIRTMLV